MGTRDGGEYWAAALPLATPESERAGSLFSERADSPFSERAGSLFSERAGSLFSEPEGAGSPMTVGSPGEPMAVDSPEGHGAADRAESPALALPGAASGAAPALSGAGSQQPSEVVEITDPVELTLLGLGPWAQYPWHGQPSDRSFGIGRAGIHNLDAGQEKTFFEALRAEHDTDLTVGDVLRRVHRILQDARPGRRIAVHPDDVIALHQRYHRQIPDYTTQPVPEQATPPASSVSRATVPPAQWLDEAPEDERTMALTVGEYVAEHSGMRRITKWKREVALPSGRVRKIKHWIGTVRAGTVPLHPATVRYLEALSFFTAEQLATARERSKNAPSITVPSEHLLDGIPDDERILALALKDYVMLTGGVADVTAWGHEVTLSTGRKRVSAWLKSLRAGYTTVGEKTVDYLKGLSMLSEADLAKVKRVADVVPPPVELLDGAPAHERTAALLSAEYMVQHRGDHGLLRAQQRFDFSDGRPWILGSWVNAVRTGQLAVSRETFSYLERLPFFFRPGAAVKARIVGAPSAAVASTSSQGDLARSAGSSVPPGVTVSALQAPGNREGADAEAQTARTGRAGAVPAFSAPPGDWRMPASGSGSGSGWGQGPAPAPADDPHVIAGVGSVPQWQWISQGVVQRGADYRVTGQGRRPAPITRLVADRHGWNTGKPPAAVPADVPAGEVPWSGSPTAPFFVAAHRAPGGVDVPTRDGIRTMTTEQFADHVAEVTRAVHPRGPIVLLVAYAAADGEYLPRMVAARTGRTVWATDGSLALRPQQMDPRLAGSGPATWIVLSRADEAAAWPRWLPSSPAMLAGNTDGGPQHEIHTAKGPLRASELSSRTLVDERGAHLGRAMFDVADWAARSSIFRAMGRHTTWAVGHPLGSDHLAHIQNADSFPLPWAGSGRPTPYFFAAHGFPNTVLANDIWQRGRPLDGEALGQVLKRRPSLQLDRSREIVLFVCFGASPAADGRSTAQQVADITGRTVHAADGIVAFDPVEEESLVESGRSWYTFRPGRPPQAMPYQQPVSRRQQYSAAPTMGRYFTDQPDAGDGVPSPASPSRAGDRPWTVTDPYPVQADDTPGHQESFFRAFAQALPHAGHPQLFGELAAAQVGEAAGELRSFFTRQLGTEGTRELTDGLDSLSFGVVSPDELRRAGIRFAPGSPQEREFGLSGRLPFGHRLPPEQSAALAAELLRRPATDYRLAWHSTTAELLPALAAKLLDMRVSVVDGTGRVEEYGADDTVPDQPHVVLRRNGTHFAPAEPGDFSAQLSDSPDQILFPDQMLLPDQEVSPDQVPSPERVPPADQTPAPDPDSSPGPEEAGEEADTAPHPAVPVPPREPDGTAFMLRGGDLLIGPDGTEYTLTPPQDDNGGDRDSDDERDGSGNGFWAALARHFAPREINPVSRVVGRRLPEGAALDPDTPFPYDVLLWAGVDSTPEARRTAPPGLAPNRLTDEQREQYRTNGGRLPDGVDLRPRQRRDLIKAQLFLGAHWSEATAATAAQVAADSFGAEIVVVDEDGTHRSYRPAESRSVEKVTLVRRGSRYVLATARDTSPEAPRNAPVDAAPDADLVRALGAFAADEGGGTVDKG
ncbi:hypothetical protein, partial [Streptomyces violaceorubidus]